VKSRGKKAKTDATAAPPVSKGKKGAEKKATSADDEAAKEQEEADEVDALADEPAENGAAGPSEGAFPTAHPLISFLFSILNIPFVDVVPGSQKLLTRLGQTLPQAGSSSSKAPKSKPSSVKPLKRPNAPFSPGPVPEPRGFLNFFFVYPVCVVKFLSIMIVLFVLFVEFDSTSAYRAKKYIVISVVWDFTLWFDHSCPLSP